MNYFIPQEVLKIRLFDDLKKGLFKKRLNRFLVECSYENKTIEAFLPNPGRLWELLQKDRIVYFGREKDIKNEKRLTDFTVHAIERDGKPVFLNTHKTNEIAKILIENNMIPEFSNYKIEKSEYSMNGNRFDFLLKKDKEFMLLEVKSCTLFYRNFAMFPDAVTSRGKRQLMTLANCGIPGGILFIVQSILPDFFLPEYHIDPEFSHTLYTLRDRILIKALGIHWDNDLTIKGEIKHLSIPWHLYEEEAKDRGCYFLILKNSENRTIKIGKLNEVFFMEGFYVYVGTAMKNLEARIRRHRRKRKNLFWHIDYLRDKTQLLHAIPIRTSKRNECEIANKINSISDSSITGFGASDCSCNSHLFYFKRNPLELPEFIETLLNFKMSFI